MVGGGEAAARKVSLLRKAQARVTVVARLFDDTLSALRDAHVQLIARDYQAGDLDGVVLVIAATGDRALNRAVASDAGQRNLPINAVDDPESCSVIVPAIIDRSPVLIAVGTGGSAPVLARLWRGKIEAHVPAQLGELAAFAAALRSEVRARLPDISARRRFWEDVFEGPVAELFLAGEREAAERALQARLAAHSSGGDPAAHGGGVVCLIGAGPNEPELVSLRALRYLQSADLVLSAPDVSEAIVDLSRRDAVRANIATWPLVDAAQVLLRLANEASAGRRACVLARGDAFRQSAGIAFAARVEAAGLSCIVVAGVA
ncbi:MAG: hypothetical protein RL701_3979 [Pseudomonadota bacterium]